jgi:hypothetical protein
MEVYMHCAILGNGPSKHLYDFTAEYVIGCNIPSEDIKIDATVISDIEIVWILKENPNLVQVPVIISDKVFEKMKELKIVSNYTILLVFKPQDWHNSAHYAAHYLSTEKKATTIDVWGCDSLVTEDLTSSTDEYVPKPETHNSKLITNWNKVWKALMLSYEEVHFRIMVL